MSKKPARGGIHPGVKTGLKGWSVIDVECYADTMGLRLCGQNSELRRRMPLRIEGDKAERHTASQGGLRLCIINQTKMCIRDRGMTVLLVEQNAKLALEVCQRGYVMESGEITLTDEAANLLANPRVREAYLGE